MAYLSGESMTQIQANIVAPEGRIEHVAWHEPSPPSHEFLAVICPEEEGGFSAVALFIPGVISQGETIEEARTNIREAFEALLESCKRRGEPLPSSASPVIELTEGSRQVWITSNG